VLERPWLDLATNLPGAEARARADSEFVAAPVRSTLARLIEGMVVTVNDKEFKVKSQPVGVSVVPRRQVARWLLRHGDVIPNAHLVAIYEAARRSTTWRP
jgi:hypothetical protein